MSSTDGRRTETADRVAELLDKGMSVLEIARLLNISPQAVYRQIHRHGLDLPSNLPQPEPVANGSRAEAATTSTNNEGDQRGK